MSQGLFPRVPTTLDLNGPVLSFTTNPVGVATTSGQSVTLTGIATVSFGSTADNTGSIAYRWYEDGVGALSDGTKFTGTGTTTLTISNATTPDDNNRKFYLQADYVPSVETGNASNEPLVSGIATITVAPLIEIVAEPTDRQAVLNANATFTVDAGLTDTSYGSVSYQWTLNGEEVDDGVIQTITRTSTTIPTEQEYNYTNDATVTLNNATNVEITVAGARGGSGGSDAGGPGGRGAQGRAGKFTYANGTRTLSLRVGRRGNDGGSGNFPAYGAGGSSTAADGGRGGGAGGSGWSGGGGGGGGASAVYDQTAGVYTIVSAGGGGTDLTPYYPYPKDFKEFHQTLQRACDSVILSSYEQYKETCDQYFTIRHRAEMRGVGGIFFDYLSGTEVKHADLVRAVGESFLPAYAPIVERRKDESFEAVDTIFQKIRRGRYVEFNLIYDRGTLFGLRSGGRIESIFMSLPPEVEFHYNWQPESGSAQEEMLSYYQPYDWING